MAEQLQVYRRYTRNSLLRRLKFIPVVAQMPSDSLTPDEFPRAVAVVLGLALAFALSLLVLYAFNVPG
jgi:hypothetical protein